MGCATSKLDDLPAVALCRERCTFLDEAIHQRYALAEAHAAYLHSLKTVGVSLDRFFNQDTDGSNSGPSSPVLNLPAQRKGDPPEPTGSPSEKIHHLHSHSDSGSHLHFHSDSEDEEVSGSESLHHHDDAPSPVPPYGGHLGFMPDYDTFQGDGRFTHINYMKKQTTPSVVYEQRPVIPETIYMGESSASSSYPSYPYSYANNNQNPPSYPYYYNNSVDNFANYPDMGAGGGYFGSSMPQARYGKNSFPPNAAAATTSSSKSPPPPPPPPPSSSTWDFLNPFESFEKYYPPYTSSRDTREVREEEGIPDLEDENDEVVKEVHGNQKFVDSGRSSYSKAGTSGPANEMEDERVLNDNELRYRGKPSVGMESDPVEYEVHMVDKKVVNNDDRSKDRGNVAGFKARSGFKVDSEVVKEIQVQFERASESGTELSKLLEVGKLPYKHKHGGNHVSYKILQLPGVASQTSKSSENENADPNLDVDHIVGSGSRNISSTLHKLYLWEKKLYEEVKVEEKMRVLHDRKSNKLKHLDQRGAEAPKIDATRALVRSLSTKIRIAIQVVDKISVKINSLRDEELWPQLNEFIQGLTRMWKSMLECHHNQYQAIGEAKRLDAIALRKHFTDAHLEATRQLEHDLINWTLRFSYWVGAQKGYVRALNNWLLKCILYVPEETPDGVVPFSPGRIGAPPVFVICYQWSQSLEGISEKEVVDSMQDFVTSVLQLWDRDKLEMRRRMLANKDDTKVKGLEREDQKIQKQIQALDKRMVLISRDDSGLPLAGRAVYQSETSKSGSIQASLQHLFKAMEKYTADAVKVYEELLRRIEEDHLAREQHEQVS